MFVRQLIEN